MQYLIAIVTLTLGCGRESDANKAPQACSCTPAEAPFRDRIHGDEVLMGSPALLNLVKTWQKQQAFLGSEGRDAQPSTREQYAMLVTRALCDPCRSWISDSDRLEAMFPLEFVDQATGAGCLFLLMPDGTRRYGQLRPLECRK